MSAKTENSKELKAAAKALKRGDKASYKRHMKAAGKALALMMKERKRGKK